jgi:hypothetical protein
MHWYNCPSDAGRATENQAFVVASVQYGVEP